VERDRPAISRLHIGGRLSIVFHDIGAIYDVPILRIHEHGENGSVRHLFEYHTNSWLRFPTWLDSLYPATIHCSLLMLQNTGQNEGFTVARVLRGLRRMPQIQRRTRKSNDGVSEYSVMTGADYATLNVLYQALNSAMSAATTVVESKVETTRYSKSRGRMRLSCTRENALEMTWNPVHVQSNQYYRAGRGLRFAIWY
jgi:hypothetical protein